ncbi:hypothetical protein HYC85_009142 [Camellia sinensis]|uniref:ABC-2 type transporter domain-containing protein n=1 Tax=Camellia sinensis TaxID=4442 RepID=A0A7J7HGU6_CAMSI|nr:hypothetical protein HYC85_009142 [Camellia sinensis]
MESETNSIDRAVANLMFSKVDSGGIDLLAAVSSKEEAKGTTKQCNYSLNQPQQPHWHHHTRSSTGDAEVPIFGIDLAVRNPQGSARSIVNGADQAKRGIVMRTVRNTVDTGRTVVCTIHQPSIDIFEAFDELLLMKRGGNVIYAGPLGRHSHKLVEYFEAVPGVPNITEGYNPATWMLDVSSTSVEAQLDVDFAEIYANSGLYQHQQEDLLNLLGATYSAVLFLGASNANAVQIVVAVERTVFYRERAAGMYSELPYAFAQVAIETFYVVIQTFIYAFLLYSMIGFEWTTVKFFYFYYFIFMCFTYFSMYGMMVVALTPNHQIAAIVMSFFFSFWNLFSGFLIPRPVCIYNVKYYFQRHIYTCNRDHMVGWVKSRFRSLLVKVTAQDVSTML